MKVLLIAVDEQGLDIGHEIAQISALHQTTVLTDSSANIKTILAEASNNQYDIVHFAGHTNTTDLQSLDSVKLANEEITLSQMARILRTADAELFFMNSCLAARFGFYVVSHGTPSSIFTTVNIDDGIAWQIAAEFYKQLAILEKASKKNKISSDDFRLALKLASNGSGLYGWADSGPNSYITKKLDNGFILLLISIGATALILSILTILTQIG